MNTWFIYTGHDWAGRVRNSRRGEPPVQTSKPFILFFLLVYLHYKHPPQGWGSQNDLSHFWKALFSVLTITSGQGHYQGSKDLARAQPSPPPLFQVNLSLMNLRNRHFACSSLLPCLYIFIYLVDLDLLVDLFPKFFTFYFNLDFMNCNKIVQLQIFCSVALVVSNSLQPHGLKPPRLLRPFPGISQERILEWVAFSFSKGFFPHPGIKPTSYVSPVLQADCLPLAPANLLHTLILFLSFHQPNIFSFFRMKDTILLLIKLNTTTGKAAAEDLVA